jgi:hypothetical protein
VRGPPKPPTTTTVLSIAAAATSLRGVGMSGRRDQPAGDAVDDVAAALDAGAPVVVGCAALVVGAVDGVGDDVQADRTTTTIAMSARITQVVTDL